MAERQKGMGRGLAAILSVAPRDDSEELREVAVELIVANPHQPRTNFDEASLLALSESIKVRGVLQPVLVRPLPDGRFELIAGERRWRAARIAQRAHRLEDGGERVVFPFHPGAVVDGDVVEAGGTEREPGA